MKTDLMTPEFRVSFPEVFEPKAFGNSAAKYSVCMLFPRTDEVKDFFTKCKRIEAQVIAEKWGENVPDGLKTLPINDGNKKSKLQGYKDHYFITPKSGTKPGLVDGQIQPIIDREQFYGGCYAKATLNIYAYEYREGGTVISRGVTFGLNNIMKTKDGDAFSGRTRPEDDFQPIESEDASEYGGFEDMGNPGEKTVVAEKTTVDDFLG